MLTFKKFNDITQIKMGRKIFGKVPFFSYAFLVDDLLIDTGPPVCKQQILDYCKNFNVSKAVNTHHHEDHVGGNRMLQQKCGVEIYADYLTTQILTQPMPIQLYRQLAWGNPDSCQVQLLSSSIKTSSGRVLKVIPTPGHCDDHVCFFEEKQGWLFTGDAFLHPKIKVLRNDEDFHQILSSLKKMKALKPSFLFCSLNGRLSNACNLMNRKIEFMETLIVEANKLNKQGLLPQQIRKELLGNENSWFYFTSGHFSKQNLINSILNPAL